MASGRFWTPDVPMPIQYVILKSILHVFEAEKAKASGDAGT